MNDEQQKFTCIIPVHLNGRNVLWAADEDGHLWTIDPAVDHEWQLTTDHANEVRS